MDNSDIEITRHHDDRSYGWTRDCIIVAFREVRARTAEEQHRLLAAFHAECARVGARGINPGSREFLKRTEGRGNLWGFISARKLTETEWDGSVMVGQSYIDAGIVVAS